VARKLLSTLPDHSAESRSWSQPASGDSKPCALPTTSAASQLEQARDIFAVLAQAQRGLACESQADSVTLSFSGAPGAEAAIVEAAERFSARGDLVLERGPMLVRLRGPTASEIDDLHPPSNLSRLEASAD
jgi:hypothetical protein